MILEHATLLVDIYSRASHAGTPADVSADPINSKLFRDLLHISNCAEVTQLRLDSVHRSGVNTNVNNEIELTEDMSHTYDNRCRKFLGKPFGNLWMNTTTDILFGIGGDFRAVLFD